jgi:prolyl-tRNA editing enzyme YbaK/EbsC (Cys-tRNA(Pro) deacylase)
VSGNSLACTRTASLARCHPFGALYHQRVFVDQSLVGEAEMVFNAGTHTDAIRMHYGDFAELSNPVVGAFARPPAAGTAAEAGAGA